MFRLVRFVISCLLLSAFIWFAVSVPLGRHTLWGHAVRIARTDEAQDLASGAKDTAKDVARRMHDELRPGEEDKGAKKKHPPVKP